MLPYPKTRLLFFDLETVGEYAKLTDLQQNKPGLYKVFMKYQDWFVKKFPEDKDKTMDEIYETRAALVPEFAKIICVSVAFVMDNGEIKKQSFYGDDEKVFLKEDSKQLQEKNMKIEKSKVGLKNLHDFLNKEGHSPENIFDIVKNTEEVKGKLKSVDE